MPQDRDYVDPTYDITLRGTILRVEVGLLVYPIRGNQPAEMRTLLDPGTYAIMREIYYDSILGKNIAWVITSSKKGFVGLDFVDWQRIPFDQSTGCYVYS